MYYLKYLLLLLVSFSILLFNINCAEVDDHAGETDAEQAADHEDEEDSVILDDKTRELIGLKTAEVVHANIDMATQIPGRIIADENKEIHVNTLVSGRVNELMVNWGDHVKKGQPLICIESVDVGRKRADHQKAYAVLQLAEKDYERKRKLFEQEAVSEKQLLEAENNKLEAEISYEYASKMLLLTGLDEKDITNPLSEHNVINGCSVHLSSPIDGEIIERSVRIGEQIDPGICVMKILDVTKVWIEADIFEKDIKDAKVNGKIKLYTSAYPDKEFTGKIFYIGSVIDEKTRTVKIRSEVQNPDKLLKPGMYCSVDLVTGIRENVIAVPEEAVLNDGGINYVFVQHGDEYHQHVVQMGIRGSGMIEILSGVSEGSQVVVQGNFQLKSRMLNKGATAGDGHAH